MEPAPKADLATPAAPPAPLASLVFDGLVFALGVLVFAGAVGRVLVAGEWLAPWPYLISIPLIVVIRRFPLILDRAEGTIEIGFDSSVLIFLACLLPAEEALVLWSLGVLIAQVTNDSRAEARRFNIGIGIVAGAAAVLVISALRGDTPGTPHELLAVALGAAGYFLLDFLISAVSVGLEERSSVLRQVIQPGATLAVACFVPFDALGYLGAVVVRSAPVWTVLLLTVPLVTLLVATRAVTRGREHARRLGALFDAAVRAQSLPETQQVLDALVEDARRLLHVGQLELRAAAPGPQEVGARLYDGQRDLWIVAPARHRVRSTIAADRQALEAMAAVSSDAFARLRLTEEMTHLAQHDPLTGLPNRSLLLERVEHAQRIARRTGTAVALLFCDLDGFKRVNDRFGHACGDDVLVDAARQLAGCLREADTVARLGGDEFAILLEDVLPDQVDVACQRVLEAMRPSAVADGQRLPLTTSIGVALGEHGQSAEELLRNADIAMYQAKGLGKNRYVFYEPSLGRARAQRQELVDSLRTAVAAGELRLDYQPVVRLDTGRVIGVEALARWTSDGVAVPADVFIGAAEDSGLVVDLGELVLDLAAGDAGQLAEAFGEAPQLGVNISAQQLRSRAFVQNVEARLARMTGVRLTLEVTARDFVNDDPVALEAMARLSREGVRFAVDDFGIGFPSIGYLQRLPVSVLKTDASFSAGIDREERSCRLLRSLVVMGRALGADVIVEAIERPSQVEHLRAHVGATLAQGYLFHRPMPLADVVDVLRGKPGADGGPAHGVSPGGEFHGMLDG
ncbi:MAG: putative bifunctional diguanylate cyclase/phosphodiesterase [Nocardioidaceae bacterium]